MSDQLGTHTPSERVEADAVCAQCGTVNAEATLICKVCGNNLRDQRARRLAAGGIDGAQPDSARGSRGWITGLLATLGLILVLVVSLSADSIMNALISGQETDLYSARAPWTGPGSDAFDALAQELAQSAPSDAVIDAAIANPVPHETLGGMYAVLDNRGNVTGVANVEAVSGPLYRFVASLYDGSSVRGFAESRAEGNIFVPYETAGSLVGGVYYSVTGFADPRPDGSMACVGQSDISAESVYEFSVYPIPSR